MKNQSTSKKATYIGFGAILLWAMLAVLVSLLGEIPPFQMLAMSFYIAFFIGLIAAFFSQVNLIEIAKMPLKVWALGVSGLFGYHFLLFSAFKNAPVLQVNLINYLWPLLIVLFSSFLPKTLGGGGLKYWHIIGALFGFGGMVLIISSGDVSLLQNSNWFGLILAWAAAIVWASYSVLCRLVAHISSHAITLFCLVTAIASTFMHLYFEQTIFPQDLIEWLAIFALGVGPVGGAFYLWDYGMKHGDIAILGASAYLTPLLSTFMLVLFNISQPDFRLWIATIFITFGAVFAAKDVIFMVNKK